MPEALQTHREIRVPTLHGQFTEGQDILRIARIAKFNGNAFTREDVATVTLKVFDRSASTVAEGQGSEASGPELPIHTEDVGTGSISDSLILDGAWDADDIGYNFRHTLPGDRFDAKGGGKYLFQYTVDTGPAGSPKTSGVGKIFLEAVLTCRPVAGS